MSSDATFEPLGSDPTEDEVVAWLERTWGTEVVRADDGLLRYEPRPRSIPELLTGVERWGDRTYLVHGDRRVTFVQFLAAVRSGAAWLTERGVAPGDRVVILSYNRAEFVLLLWSIWWLGAVPVMGNRWWNANELDHGLGLTRPRLVVRDDGGHPIETVDTAPISDLGAVLDQPEGDGPPAHVPAGEHEEALVMFTSGTSGSPKAVVLSQGAVVANQHNLLKRSRQLPHTFDLDREQAVMLTATPLFHVGGISNLTTQLLTGGRLVLMEGRFDAGQVLELVEREGVHRIGGVPTIASRVLEHPDVETRDLSSLRSFPLGGAPVTQALLDRMARKLPQLRERGLANTYGMTETGGFVTVAGSADIEERPGTVGRPYETAELRIADPDEGGVGELLVRSATVMEGYLGPDGEVMPPGPDAAIDRHGWFHTGDLGHLDDDGYLYLDGRLKEIVIRAGENIASAQVEKAILGHGEVVEAAVFGIPHHDLGEELVAVVRRRAGSTLDAEELTDHLRGVLANFQVPSVIDIRDEALPTLAGEKVDKPLLKEQLTNGAAT